MALTTDPRNDDCFFDTLKQACRTSRTFFILRNCLKTPCHCESSEKSVFLLHICVEGRRIICCRLFLEITCCCVLILNSDKNLILYLSGTVLRTLPFVPLAQMRLLSISATKESKFPGITISCELRRASCAMLCFLKRFIGVQFETEPFRGKMSLTGCPKQLVSICIRDPFQPDHHSHLRSSRIRKVFSDACFDFF